VYCLIREQWGRVSGEFDLDHFVPQHRDPALAQEYDNLLYACGVCNLAKSNYAVPDPTQTFTDDQVLVYEDGGIVALTDEADRLIRILDLNDDDYCRWRKTWIRIIELAKSTTHPCTAS
jgi:hypothetical protein